MHPSPDLYRVRTPENVAFDFEVAGLASRGAAWLIDLVVMAALVLAASLVLALAAPVAGGAAGALQLVIVFLVQWWYQTLFEWRMGGQTIGKRIVGIRVLSRDGLGLSFSQAVIRNLVRFVDLLPATYLVGVITAVLDPHGRRLGDLAAGTVVVRERRAPRPSAVVPPSERYNTFLDDPAVRHAARRITPPERDAMVGLGLRREELPLALRHHLFARLAGHLERRLGVPRPPYFSEEKYVLHLTAVLLDEGTK